MFFNEILINLLAVRFQRGDYETTFKFYIFISFPPWYSWYISQLIKVDLLMPGIPSFIRYNTK